MTVKMHVFGNFNVLEMIGKGVQLVVGVPRTGVFGFVFLFIAICELYLENAEV